MPDDAPRCELCQRAVPEREKHHLIPRTRHRNKKNKKDFDRDEVKGRLAWLCPACHDQVHALLTEKELERHYNTLPDLAGHPQLARFVRWVRKRPAAQSVRTRASRAQKDRRQRR
jgi:hypothetical protein